MSDLLKDEAERLYAENKQIRESMRASTLINGDLAKWVTELQNKGSDQQRQIDELQNRVDRLLKNNAALSIQATEVIGERDKLKRENAEKTNEFIELRTKYNAIVFSTDTKWKELEDDRNSWREAACQRNDELNVLKSKAKDRDGIIASQGNQINNLIRERDEFRHEAASLGQMNSEYRQQLKGCKQIQSSITPELREKLDEAEAVINQQHSAPPIENEELLGRIQFLEAWCNGYRERIKFLERELRELKKQGK